LSPLLLFVLLSVDEAEAVERETVLAHAVRFSTHEWTMREENRTASCSSEYESDYAPGVTYKGLPYDWGGWVTCEEYDEALAEGYGAGSHSWHGVLWCTVGLDCSGFVSQVWETDHKYGTATLHEVSTEIEVSALERGDALNKPSSHVVLFAYLSDAGRPIHYESAGELVGVDVNDGWSSFNGYTAIRYDAIEEGPSTGTFEQPIEITAFPFEDLRGTAGAASDRIDVYDCAPDLDESGPEQVYRFSAATGGTLSLRVSDEGDTDIDLHVLDGPSGDACLARAHEELVVDLPPGVFWIVADTWVGSYEFAGPYLLTATFTGELGEPPEDTGSETADTSDDADTQPPDSGGKRPSPPPGSAVRLGSGGCACAVPVGPGFTRGVHACYGLLAGILLSLTGLRRSRGVRGSRWRSGIRRAPR
jgi:hypothetical protein